MKNLKMVFMIAAVSVIAAGTFAMQHNSTPKTTVDSFWQLKSGHSISTNPSDYEQTGSPCGGSETFCGFTAPDNGSGEPVIGTALAADITALESNPDSQSNESGQVSFKN